MADFFVTWLIEGGVGPAAVAVPVNWAAAEVAGAARRWFRRLRRTDDLSRLVRAATGTMVDLTRAEFDDVRRLLEDAQTWSVAGRGTVEDLAGRIASCLSPRDGRTAGDSRAAAMAIARALLEFAVADVDPKLFQRVLLTRLQRMEAGQVSALDEALLSLHADLAGRLAAQGELDAQRFASVLEHLKLVLDRQSPGPVAAGQIVVYLTTLIAWLNADPWPRDRRFEGPALTPAAIERKLRVTPTGRVDKQDLDADDLSHQCQRLVILGGPGSGKTWLARRAARHCAGEALQALASGRAVDEIELPLYTTCSGLVGASGDIREAVVSSALSQLADLGGSRLSAALRSFFTERNGPVLLVLDSLDEAHGADERLRQADTLPWRIILTSRPSSWNQQLVIDGRDSSRQAGELQPVRYPDDVEPFIQRWFAQQPQWGKELSAQIARRPSLQKAVTVPLILAFYCIVGGSTPLPEFRHDLHTKILKRMLTGRWRGSRDRQPDVDACLQALRTWAWSGATSHPVSGIGTWADDIRTGEADDDALDHVAVPLSLPDIDTGKILRRFVHRSIREHLVADHVARLPVDLAAQILIPHLWHDPDWEYAAPAALAMHPQRDKLVRKVLCSAARSDQIPEDLSVIDAGWQIRGLLARVAAESSESHWSPDVAEMIAEARAELARCGVTSNLREAAGWQASTRQVREELLGRLATETEYWRREELMNALADLEPTAEEKRKVRRILLAGLANEPGNSGRRRAVGAIRRFDATAQDKRQARRTMLRLLADDRSSWMASELVDALVQLDQGTEDERDTREALLTLLADQGDGRAVPKMLAGIARLAVTPQDKRQAREILLKMLADQHDAWMTSEIASGLVQLDPTTEDKQRAREILRAALTHQTDISSLTRLTSALIQIDPTPQDRRHSREAMLRSLARESETDSWTIRSLTDTLALLNPTAQDKQRAREVILRSFPDDIETDEPVTRDLIEALIRIDATAQDKRRAREAILRLLATQDYGVTASNLADELVLLDPTAEDERRARWVLFGLLASRHTDGVSAAFMVYTAVKLNPTAPDKRWARKKVLQLLAQETETTPACELARALNHLDPAMEDKLHAREALLALITTNTDESEALSLMSGVAHLDPTTHDVSNWYTWAIPPSVELLAAVRRNSAPEAWLEAIPLRASLSD